MNTSTISFRINPEIKDMAKPILEAQGLTISDLCQSVLQYVAETGQIPVKKVLLSEEDEELLLIAKERLAEPGSIAVKLEEL